MLHAATCKPTGSLLHNATFDASQVTYCVCVCVRLFFALSRPTIYALWCGPQHSLVEQLFFLHLGQPRVDTWRDFESPHSF